MVAVFFFIVNKSNISSNISSMRGSPNIVSKGIEGEILKCYRKRHVSREINPQMDNGLTA